MLTVPNLPITADTPWPLSARVGTVVRMAFPFTEKRRGKVRPCVIVALDRTRQEAVVAYGTKRLYGSEDSEHALRLVAQYEYMPAGLDQATRFQIDRRVRVPLTSSRFRFGPEGQPPVLGQLAPRVAQRAADIYAALAVVDPAMEAEGIHPGPSEKRGRLRLHRRRDRREIV